MTFAGCMVVMSYSPLSRDVFPLPNSLKRPLLTGQKGIWPGSFEDMELVRLSLETRINIVLLLKLNNNIQTTKRYIYIPSHLQLLWPSHLRSARMILSAPCFHFLPFWPAARSHCFMTNTKEPTRLLRRDMKEKVVGVAATATGGQYTPIKVIPAM